jgi:hypothetical protein
MTSLWCTRSLQAFLLPFQLVFNTFYMIFWTKRICCVESSQGCLSFIGAAELGIWVWESMTTQERSVIIHTSIKQFRLITKVDLLSTILEFSVASVLYYLGKKLISFCRKDLLLPCTLVGSQQIECLLPGCCLFQPNFFVMLSFQLFFILFMRHFAYSTYKPVK